MKFTNLKKHGLIGLAAGFVLGLTANFFPWMEKVPGHPLSSSVITTWALGLILWLAVVIIWEIWQYLVAGSQSSYIAKKWKDSLADIMVGFVCFLIPWTVIVLGTYVGNTLRP
jgi:hypothetical protein